MSLWVGTAGEHLCNTGANAGSCEASWIDFFFFFFFSQVWLWDTPNLLTHIHHTLLCAGLKCVWERKRQEKRTPSVCYVMLNGWKKKKKTCSVGQPLQPWEEFPCSPTLFWLFSPLPSLPQAIEIICGGESSLGKSRRKVLRTFFFFLQKSLNRLL